MENKPKISIVIPVFNEEKRLLESIQEIFSYVKKSGQKFEVIIVDDGSFDQTPKILSDLKKKFPIKVLVHQKNLGKGAAIKTGINAARGDLILFTDIDLSVPIEFAQKYEQVMDDETDVVIGTREKKGAKVEVRQFWLRELLGLMFTLISNAVLWVGVSDFTCGFKMYRKKAAQRIFSRQMIKRWAFDAESLFIAKKHHFKVKEVPVVWRHREGSKVRFPQDLIETLISLFIIRMNDFSGKYD